MARKKSNKITNAFTIFFSSIRTYFLYLDRCAKYLTFPIMGQVLGFMLIFSCTYYFNTNMENLKSISPFVENNLLTIFFIILLPFFIIFIKAVYDYIIAFCALNTVFYTVSNKRKVKDIDFSANKKAVEKRLVQYVILMFLVTIILAAPLFIALVIWISEFLSFQGVFSLEDIMSLIALLLRLLPFLFIAPVIWIFICLSFQVFSLENNVSAIKAIARSIELVKGNITATIIMLVLCYALTYAFLPSLFIWAFEKISVISFLINKIGAFLQLLSFDGLKIDSLTIAKYSAESIISMIVIGYTLPFRCCCFTELYRLYDSEKIKDFSKESDEIIARATGKKRKN